MEEPLSLAALGTLEVRRGGRLLDPGPPLRRCLLALLAHAVPHPVPVPRLVDHLWPAASPRDPVRNLQVHVSALRAVLGEHAVTTVGKAYRLDVAPEQVDVHRFTAEAAEASRLLARHETEAAHAAAQRALGLWRGEAWADVRHLPVLDADAADLERRRVDVAVVSFTTRLELGRHREVVAELEAWVERMPLREDLWELLVLALHRSGRQADALAAYAAARDRKVAETGLEPGPALRALHARVLADDPGLVVEDGELRRRRRLPAPPSRLLGREQEVAMVLALLRGDARLVTLTGPGGIGKTRIALQAAHELAADFPDGVWFVALADVRDPALVARTVAEALAVEDVEGDVVGPLREHLRDRRLLLVLDNFEQVDDAAPLVSDLVAAGEGVAVLVTSRTRLRVYGEHVRPVEPLPSEVAVPLFTARAQEVAPWFGGSGTEVARVCEALDRVPLALELVAARADEIDLEDMAGQLDDRLGLASGGPRDRSHRQRSLRGAIGWSTDLLSPAHREVFQRLGVFVGGFDRAAAAHIAGADVMALADLVRASLVQVDSDGRHRMLETIREFARDSLAGEHDAVAAAHARWHLDLAESAADGMRGGGRTVWYPRMHAERGNMRVALEHFAGSGRPGDVERLLRLASALGLYWYRVSPWTEDVEWLPRAIALGAGADPALLGRVHHALAICRGEQGRAEEALVHSRESYERLSEADDQTWVARALNSLAGLTRDLGRPVEAVPMSDRAIALRRSLGDPLLPLAVALANRAMIALDLDDPATARTCLEECLRLESDEVELALARSMLADVALSEGDAEEAAGHLATALPVLQAAGQRYRLTEALELLAGLAALRSRPALAATFAAAADRALADSGAVQVPADATRREQRCGAAIAALDPGERAAAEARGASLDLDTAIGLGSTLFR